VSLDALAIQDPVLLLAAALVMVLGGVVKGAVGFALPMIAVSGIGSFLDAQTTIAILIVPTFLTNLWQAIRQGPRAALETGRRFWRLILVLAVLIGLVAQAVPHIPSQTLFLVLGGIVTVVAALQLAGWRPEAPRSPGARRALEIATGVVAGVTGGLAGVWGPPVLFFLIALGVEKTALVRAQGLAYLTGSTVLVVAHLRSGLLDAATLPVSALMILPVMAGMALGLRLQDRLAPAPFRRWVLVVLCLAGLNLLRRGLA
jgi:hypothetical protein